jgi:predicted aconitase with swiveling domain
VWVPKIRLRLARIQFAFATLRGEVPHQVIVGVAEDVVAVGAVLTEVERLVLEDSDQVGEPVHPLVAIA